MKPFRLTGLDSLKELLAKDDRDRPGVIILESWTYPELLTEVRHLALDLPQFAFYEFNLDDYSDPRQDEALTRLLEEWDVTELPAQILLPSSSKPHMLKAKRLDDIEKALRRLY